MSAKYYKADDIPKQGDGSRPDAKVQRIVSSDKKVIKSFVNKVIFNFI